MHAPDRLPGARGSDRTRIAPGPGSGAGSDYGRAGSESLRSSGNPEKTRRRPGEDPENSHRTSNSLHILTSRTSYTSPMPPPKIHNFYPIQRPIRYLMFTFPRTAKIVPLNTSSLFPHITRPANTFGPLDPEHPFCQLISCG
jgi:hypothetical protein